MISNLKNLLSGIKSSSATNGEEIKKIYESGNSSNNLKSNKEENGNEKKASKLVNREDRRSERLESKEERKLNRLERKEQKRADRKERDAVNTDDLTKIDENDELTTLPVDNTEDIKKGGGDETIEELAKMYVEQYEDKSGKDLSEDEFQTKVNDVASFYGELKNGKSRLDEVVFANDQDNTIIV